MRDAPTPSPKLEGLELEEAVARIIDPKAWASFDAVAEYQGRPQHEAPWSKYWEDRAWFAKRETDAALEKAQQILALLAELRELRGEKEPELTADFARALPGGAMDDSTFEAVEEALDRADAPLQGADGKWLSLAERIAAISPYGTRLAVIDEIAAERHRQVDVEGWTPEHDDEHNDGELAKAAACYAAGNNRLAVSGPTAKGPGWRHIWPWQAQWWKPKDRRRNLVRAAALIVAEIERLDRLTPSNPSALSQAPAPQVGGEAQHHGGYGQCDGSGQVWVDDGKVSREGVARWFADRRSRSMSRPDVYVLPTDYEDADAILALLHQGLSLEGENTRARSEPCADAGTHIPRSPEGPSPDPDGGR